MAGVIGEYVLDLGLGGREPLACLAQPLDTFLKQLQRFVEIEVLGLEPPHDLLQALELAGEARLLGGGAHEPAPPTRAPTSPSTTRSRNPSPGVSWATRLSTCPSESRATAYPRSSTLSGDRASRRPPTADS